MWENVLLIRKCGYTFSLFAGLRDTLKEFGDILETLRIPGVLRAKQRLTFPQASKFTCAATH